MSKKTVVMPGLANLTGEFWPVTVLNWDNPGYAPLLGFCQKLKGYWHLNKSRRYFPPDP
jgi:hypothetical protein